MQALYKHKERWILENQQVLFFIIKRSKNLTRFLIQAVSFFVFVIYYALNILWQLFVGPKLVQLNGLENRPLEEHEFKIQQEHHKLWKM